MGLTQIVIILVLALILFGPEDLPKIARQLGKIVYQIRKAYNDLSRELRDMADMPDTVINRTFEQTIKDEMTEDSALAKNESARDPLKDLPPEMLSYEDDYQEKDAGR